MTIVLFVSVLTVLATLYAAGISRLAKGVMEVLVRRSPATGRPFVSVVIPARNESTNIGRCLTSVLAGNYPHFEVVVVDDGSTDDTAAIVQSLINQRPEDSPSVILVDSDSHAAGSGKVHAIHCGISRSSGGVIVTLDADCEVGPHWLRAMIESMTDDVGFVAGPVGYRTNGSVLRRIEALEFMSLIGVGAGAIGLGRPLICNSANAAYRRELYESMRELRPVNDFAAADELLMLFVHESSEYRVAFCPAIEALVVTDGAESVCHFLQQRMRWVSIIRYLPPVHRLLLTLAFLFFVITAAGLIGGLWEPVLMGAGLSSLLIKGLVDYRVLSPICRNFERASLLSVLPLAELLYIPYVLITAPVGMLRQPAWKGRTTTAARS